jgi:hypothetical protein
VGIRVITLFEIEIGGPLQKRSLDKVYLTALAIWMTEGIHNPEVLPLSFSKDPFIWRVNPEKGDPYFKVSGCDMGMNMLEARELLEDIESLASAELLMDDVYPEWWNHPSQAQVAGCDRYQVKLSKELLGFIDTNHDKSILPVALKADNKNECYRFVLGEKESESSPYYKFS